jgi:hypothetical protein
MILSGPDALVRQMIRSRPDDPVRQMIRSGPDDPVRQMIRSRPDDPVHQMIRSGPDDPVHQMIRSGPDDPVRQMIRSRSSSRGSFSFGWDAVEMILPSTRIGAWHRRAMAIPSLGRQSISSSDPLDRAISLA